MTSSYSIYEIAQFPQLEREVRIQAPHQLSLEFEDPRDSPQSTLEFQREIKSIEVDVLTIRYEHMIQTTGRVGEVRFSEFVAIESFPAFYFRRDGFLAVKAKKDHAKGAMRQFADDSVGLKGEARKISLDHIRQMVSRFLGVYFSVEESTDVSTLALFGSNVDRDHRFVAAASEGAMKYAYFNYDFNGELIKVGISSDSGIVIYSNSPDEVKELSIVRKIKGDLLDNATVAS